MSNFAAPASQDDIRLHAVSASDLAALRNDLVHLLQSCVHGGASIGFLAPLAAAEAVAYWDSIAPQVASGGRLVLVARDAGGRVTGTGQLGFESRSNGRHRAEVCKVMVLPSHRGQGIARRLVRELERMAHERGIRLLFLDTSEGRGGAQRFYETLGYTYAGGIPEYALDPDGRPAKNAIYYKLLP